MVSFRKATVLATGRAGAHDFRRLDFSLSAWLSPPANKTNGGLGMKQIILATALMLAATAAHAQYYGTGSNPNSHTSSGYTTSSGTYVAPHTSTNPNSTQTDNYGTRGNVNPSTGAVGTRTPRY